MAMIKMIKPNADDSYALNASRVTDGIITCYTIPSLQAKTANASNFSLETGARVLVRFIYSNAIANPTLNINNTGAKPIYYHNAAIAAPYLKANYIYEFVFDGTFYQYIGEINTDTIVNISGKADIESPAFTGTPTAPSPDITSDNTTIATTAFVWDAIESALSNFGIAETTEFPV